MSSQAGQPAEAAPSAPSGKRWLVLGAGLLALASGGVVAARRLGKEPGTLQGAEGRRPAAFEPGVLELEPFVVNLADPTGDRYLRLNLRLVLDQRAIAATAAQGLGQAKLRDRVLAILASKRAAELAAVEGKERLRAELQTESEALLAEPPFHAAGRGSSPARVVDVLFTEYLLQ
jgi:flagellar FliL protein